MDGLLPPGISLPATTSKHLNPKRTNHKIAEQVRRNRINSALKELETLIPLTSIQGQQGQELAASVVNAGEKGKKDTNKVFSKVSVLEMAIQYIKDLKLGLKEPEAPTQIKAPANLSLERDLGKITEHGPRNRINTLLKEIESLIPSYFVQARLAKDTADSEVNLEGNIKGKSVTQARSKASTVEMAIDYIRELRRNIGGSSGTLASEVIPPQAPSSNVCTEPTGQDRRSGPVNTPDNQTIVHSGKENKSTTSVKEDAMCNTQLPPTRKSSTVNGPALYDAEIRRIADERKEAPQTDGTKSISLYPEFPVKATIQGDAYGSLAGQRATASRHSPGKAEIQPSIMDSLRKPKDLDVWQDFENFLDINIPCEMLDSMGGLSQTAAEYSGGANPKQRDQARGKEDNPTKKEDGVKSRTQGNSESKDDSFLEVKFFPNTERQRVTPFDPTRKVFQGTNKVGRIESSRAHKRKFSAIDTHSAVTMISEPLVERLQSRGGSVPSDFIGLGLLSEKDVDTSTDLPWPDSLELALEQWTNLKQAEINMGIPFPRV